MMGKQAILNAAIEVVRAEEALRRATRRFNELLQEPDADDPPEHKLQVPGESKPSTYTRLDGTVTTIKPNGEFADGRPPGDSRQTTIPGAFPETGVKSRTTAPRPRKAPPSTTFPADAPATRSDRMRPGSLPVRVLSVMNPGTTYTADEIAKAIEADLKKTRGAITQLVNAQRIVAAERGKYRRDAF
jgi:hypothetical protein